MALELMSFCNICPRECGVNRGEGPGGCGHPSLGICGQGPDSKIALVSRHDWEEPPISGTRGSGTIFFSGCNLRCKYCQNFDVSRGRIGKIVSVKRLAEIFLEQQTRGMHNINLVTPTHFLLSIIEALKMAREQGLHIPVVYNTSGYEKPEAIKALDGLVDIYLSDFKYADDELGKKLSAVRDYSKCADLALDAMYDSVGSYVEDDEGIAQKGVFVRHLVLPQHYENSRKVLELLASKPYANDIVIALMNQYTPVVGQEFNGELAFLNERIDMNEYEKLVDYASELGLENVFYQTESCSSKEYIPNFDCSNV